MTLPAIPVIGLIAHMDTSPAVSGANVNAIIHADYQGGDIVLPSDQTQVITVAANPVLKDMIGDDIITADGTTLLGSDDKAGIAEIMTMVDMLRAEPADQARDDRDRVHAGRGAGLRHREVRCRGFGATFAYTVDGEQLGDIYDETWHARTATVTFTGKNTHPGTAKGLMVNSMFAFADYVSRLPTRHAAGDDRRARRLRASVHEGRSRSNDPPSSIDLRDFEPAASRPRSACCATSPRRRRTRYPDVGIEIDVRGPVPEHQGRAEGSSAAHRERDRGDAGAPA